MDQVEENALTIYTDGSCYPSPRVGGAGFVFAALGPDGQPVIHEEAPAGWRGATNNQMELQACIEALEIVLKGRLPSDLGEHNKIVICTDSTYVANNVPRAFYAWASNGWLTRSGAPVVNTSQWKTLLRLVKRASSQGLRVTFKWVKGHKTDRYNKRADKLAKESARNASDRHLGYTRVRRKKSPNPVDPGSVPPKGQVTTVRIITDEYLSPPHRCYRYKYEVMEEPSPYYQCVDIATSDLDLRAGHTYVVRFNDDPGNPRINELLEEVHLGRNVPSAEA